MQSKPVDDSLLLDDVPSRCSRTEFTCGPWKPATATGLPGRILLGRAGPVELATVVKVMASFKNGFVEGLAPGLFPRVNC